MTDSDSDSRSTKEIPSLILLLEAAAETNNVDEVSSILQQARSNAAFSKILGAGLATAAQDGHVDIVKCLLSEDKSALTHDNLLLALLAAVSAGHVEVVKLLLDSGAYVNGIPHDASYWNSWSPIAIAVLRDNAQMLKLLIARGGDVDIEGDNRQTALHILAGKGSWETPSGSEALNLLLRTSRKVHEQDSYGCTPLYYACMMNNAELVRSILSQRHGLRESLAASDSTGYNAFHIACQYSNHNIVETLLMHGADPNAIRGDGWTPMHIACHRYSTSIVGLLLDHGASVNPTTSNGTLPLHLAIDVGAVEVVKLLLQKDNVQTRDTFGDHLFFYAAERGESEIKTLLLPSYRLASVSGEMLTCDLFTATVVDFDEEGQIMDLKNTTISTLLGWVTPQPPAQVSYAQPNEFRWIHFPANNPTWLEVLLMRWAMSDGGDVEDIKRLCNMALNDAHRGQYPHSHFHRPSCQKVGEHIWACIPYLHFETVYRYRRMQDAIYKSERARMPSQNPSRDELLVRSYPVSSVGGLHIRRTLNQYAHPNLDTQSRDLDQVVLRHQLRAAHAEPKLYMVDQLWILVLGDNLVVTSFPQRWEQPENDRFNILTAVLDTLRQQRPIKSVRDLIAVITGQCCGLFDRFAPHDEHYQFFSMFEASVGFAAESEAKRFEELRRASVQASAWLKANGGSVRSFSTRHKDPSDSGSRDNPAFVDEFLDLGPETDLMFEIKDIRDEIGMIRSVLDHQLVVLPELEFQPRKLDYLLPSTMTNPTEFVKQAKMVEMYLKDLERMDRQASHLFESVLSLLDLKQKHASPFEARLAREQAADAARQGKTIMIFTIVTIVFLPLSFITSFFTIEITEFPQTAGTSTMPLSFVSKYVFGVGLGIAIPLVLIAFAAQDFKLGFRALYDFFGRGGATEKTSGIGVRRASVSRDPSTSIKCARTRPLSPEERC